MPDGGQGDMRPAVFDICRTRGDTFPFDITFTLEGGGNLPTTGNTFLLTVDPSPAPADAVNNLFQNTPTTPSDGVVRVTLSAAEADQTPGTYFYDLQMTSGGTSVRTIAKGQWVVEQDVTK